MPRTRFIFKTTRELGGQTVHLRHRVPWLPASATSAILDQVQRAKSMLSATIAVMHSATNPATRFNDWATLAIQHARTYFLIPDVGPPFEQWSEILAVLELTYNGLNSDVTLKLGADDDDGYVNTHQVAQGTPGSIRYSDGTHWTTDGHAIHIDKKKMLRDADHGVITLIHEATHRYANTWDHGLAGYRKEDDSDWRLPGLTVAEALHNADSYAHFAFRVGRDCRC